MIEPHSAKTYYLLSLKDRTSKWSREGRSISLAFGFTIRTGVHKAFRLSVSIKYTLPIMSWRRPLYTRFFGGTLSLDSSDSLSELEEMNDGIMQIHNTQFTNTKLIII